MDKINVMLGEYEHIPKGDSGTTGLLIGSIGIAVCNHYDLQAYLGYFDKRTEKLEEMLSNASDKIGNPNDMHLYMVGMAYNMIGSSEVVNIQDDAKSLATKPGYDNNKITAMQLPLSIVSAKLVVNTAFDDVYLDTTTGRFEFPGRVNMQQFTESFSQFMRNLAKANAYNDKKEK